MRYEYTIHREADGHGHIQPPEFSWHYGPWTKCTVTCGTGEARGGHGCCPARPLSRAAMLGFSFWLIGYLLGCLSWEPASRPPFPQLSNGPAIGHLISWVPWESNRGMRQAQ